jgi:transposase
MSDLYWLTEEQMARIRPYFSKSHGKPRVDDRRVLSAVQVYQPYHSSTVRANVYEPCSQSGSGYNFVKS